LENDPFRFPRLWKPETRLGYQATGNIGPANNTNDWFPLTRQLGSFLTSQKKFKRNSKEIQKKFQEK
jgi:hypothetical protein